MMLRLLLLAAAGCALAAAQPITLQSSQNGNLAANVTSITGGSNLPTGFTIYVNAAAGTFDPSVGVNTIIQWASQNTANNPSGNFPGTVNVTGSQVQGFVPFGLFQNAVPANVTVKVSVIQNGIPRSNTADFLIVPKPSGLGPNLPNGLVGTPYSAPIVKDGAAPFSFVSMVGSPPNGINFTATFDGLSGTPLGPPGVSSFTPTLQDFWNNPVTIPLNLKIIGQPTMSNVSSSSGSTYSYGTLTDLSVFMDANANPPFAANVQFRDGATLLGTASIVPATGKATLSGVFLGLGNHPNISASFAGDSNWQSVSSPGFVINVTQATPTFQLTGSPFSATYGGPLSAGSILVLGAASPAAPPTGTLTVTSGAIQIATFGVNGLITLTGTLLPAALNAGVRPLTFTYSGDTNYTTANTAGSVNIAKATPIAALNVSANPVALGQNESLTAILSSPTVGVPTGTASFLDGAVPIPSSTVNLVSGAGAFNTTSLTLGAHPISFSYSGDTNFLGVSSNPTTVTVIVGTLAFNSTFLPAGTTLTPYSATVGVTGGVPPYSFTGTGFPPGLAINPQTGLISGTPTSPGLFTPVISVTDSTATKLAGQFTLNITAPAVRISPFASLPNGVVGVGYSGTVGVNGGVDPITYSIIAGIIPPGLTFLGNGILTGTPATAGKYTFTVRVSDGANTSDSREFTVTIQPPPLSIPGASVNPKAVVGTPYRLDLGCTGGVPPYTYSVTGSLPPGITFANCILSGTPTTPGAYPIRITVTDSASVSVTRDVIFGVTPPGLSLSGGALPNGQVGVAYTATVSATGGVGTITYTAGSGLPDGLSLSSSGAITGTPTKDGQFSFEVTATQQATAVSAAPISVSATYTITIIPATLALGAVSLPDGVVGVAYSGSITATSGVKPYVFAASGLPGGLSAASDGAVTGTPTTVGTFEVTVSVTDAAKASARQIYTIKIVAPPLVITTASAPNGTVGTSYSANFNATGGVSPLTFTSTGQPATLTMSAGGTLSGTPTAPATVTITVTVKDASGATTSKNFSFAIALPPSPPLNFGGISTTIGPLQQPRVTVSLATPYPTDVLARLAIAHQPDAAPADPAVTFIGGGTTATITIPAGSLNGATDVAFQTGTVAGNIVITATLTAAGVDVTPSPAPRTTTRVAAAAPVLVSVTATRTATGFTATIVGYVTDREITTGNFTFNGSNLGTTSLSVPADTVFTTWFGGASPASTPFGGQFTYTQQFTVNGANTAITSVAVTLTNRIGVSNSITATLN